jgi:aminoglycoside phosphotransferase (APT) family kinase protein
VEIKTDAARPKTSTRDREHLQQALEAWVKTKLGDEASISGLAAPQGTGMSSETLLFDVNYREDGAQRTLRCAGRLPPDSGSVPVFPEYDLLKQFRVMQIARERSTAPVPRTLWYEADESHLGARFFVMERANGEAPPDIPPYVFDSWLLRADPADRERLQKSAVGVLAKLHSIELGPDDLALLRPAHAGETPLRRHVASQRAYYEWVAADGIRSPVIERGFAWMEANWPANDRDEVLSWGDSRIGNMLFVDFEPTAVLDWEMVATGPREIDLGWMTYIHHFFQDFTPLVGLPGLPDMMRLEAMSAAYAAASGHQPRDMEFYTLYAALRHGIVMFRIGRRQAHFGESAIPENPDDMIPHRPAIEAMLEGSYWDTRR